ncbi:glycosyl hydrolases family 2, TIM barrel domain-containing protein [Hirsutella rhossiliensis]
MTHPQATAMPLPPEDNNTAGAGKPDWNNVEVIHRNALAPRSHFFLYGSEHDALAADVRAAKALCLSGRWRFHLSVSPLEGPRDFYKPGFSTAAAGFSDITVPGMWQLQGHGQGPHYTNVVYPWPVDPPHVSPQDNECGRYLTTFTADAAALGGHRLRLRFEGVDSSFTVWLNGHSAGYSQGSRNPSEFDVTPLVRLGQQNVLAVEVYQRCDGSYLEDQDQWWLSGIFRDVYLHAFPAVHPVDFHAVTRLDAEYRDAVLQVEVQTSAPSAVELKLLDRHGKLLGTQTETVDGPGRLELDVANPDKWTAETPNLYTLVLNFADGHGPSCSLAHRVGFRSAGLVDGVFCVNGQPVKLRGVNRHEHHPDHGRAVPYDFMRRDLMLMKRCNVNALRASHQINDARLYDVADELGLWVMDEADLECHGFGDVGGDPASYTSDNPAWREHYVDRARHMVARDRNHACVVMWSLGNEAFYGRNHQAMYDCIRGLDGDARLIHYEPDSQARTADVFSRMYPTVDSVVDFAKERQWQKPLVLCEFLHAMGNSVGNAKEYIDVFYKHPRLMGGFVWEWANHGLRTRTKDGIEYMAYGGDFGDEPNDYNFIMDGLLWSEHSLTPNIAEYAKAIEPVQTIGRHRDKVTVVNRYDFLAIDHLDGSWALVADGKGVISTGRVVIPDGVTPHTEATLTLQNLDQGVLQQADGEAYLQLQFKLSESTAWAPAGHLVATGELQVTEPLSLSRLGALGPPTSKPTVVEEGPKGRLVVTSATGGSTWAIDMLTGMLTSWQRAGQAGVEMLTEPFRMDFYRALTDNDRAGHGKQWVERRLHQTTSQVRQLHWHVDNNGLSVRVDERIAPPALAWGVNNTWTYSFRGDTVSIRVQGKASGPLLPETFARIGLTLGLAGAERVRWWGRGPGESYRDKKLSQLFGDWDASIDELWVDYEFPQDGGNRTDVRRVELVGGRTDGRLVRARFGDAEGVSFSAMHYATADVDECTHPFELHRRKRADTVVRLDWMHHGLGTASCGPWTLPQYQLRSDKGFDVEILLD